MPSFKLATTLLATFALGALATSPAMAGTCGGVDVRPAAGNLDGIRATTLCLLNAERAQQGLSALTENASLTAAANAYAEQMVHQRFFDHVSPDGRTLVQRLSDVKYLGRAADWLAGENIAWAEGELATPREVMSAWMASPGHRENILEPRFREIGSGVALGLPDDPTNTDAATYTTEFGMVNTTAEPSVVRRPAKRVKRRCPRGRRLAVKRKGKRVVRRCVAKRRAHR